MMARKLRPLMRKQMPSPNAATVSPARAGPTSRAPLNMAELRAMALVRSSFRSTMSITKACRVGMSKALTKPRQNPRTKICQTAMWPVRVSTPSMAAWIMASRFVRRSSRRRSHRSTKTPARGGDEEHRSHGNEADEAEERRRAGEPVNEPAHGDLLHPRADEREALAREKQSVVPMPEGPPRKQKAAFLLCLVW